MDHEAGFRLYQSIQQRRVTMKELTIYNDNKIVLKDFAAEEIAKIEIAIKELQEREKALKAALLEEMTAKDILSVEHEVYGVAIKRIDSFSRESLDSKKLKQEKPDIYDKYVKITEVKPSVRITIK